MNKQTIDKKQVERNFNRAAKTCDEAGVLSREAGNALMTRLALIKIEPKVVLDLGCGTGYFSRLLAKRYKQSNVIGIDFARQMIDVAKRDSTMTSLDFQQADAEHLPLENQSVDLVFSNMMLPFCDDLNIVVKEVKRVLRPNGLFIFSSLGPDSFDELRESWSQVDEHARTHLFIDMHDVGDLLLHHGLLDPVVEAEPVMLTYSSVDNLLQEIKSAGMQNALTQRLKGLTTPRKLSAIKSAYRRHLTKDQKFPITIEFVYGHAWMPDLSGLSRQMESGEHVFSIDDITKTSS